MDEPGRTKRRRRGLFLAGLGVRLAGLVLIWVGDGSDSLFRKGLVVAGLVLSVGGIAVLRYLLFAPLLSRRPPRLERPPGESVATGRPWWRRKRWAAAGLLWLLVAYPLSVGPANYAAARGWLPEAWLDPAYFPVRKAADRPELMEGYVRYVMGWRKSAWRHQGHLVDDPNEVSE